MHRANWNRTTPARKRQQVSDKEGKTKGMQTRKRVRTQCNTGSLKILQPESIVPGEEVVVNGETDTLPQQQRNAGQAQENKKHDQTVTTHNNGQYTTKKKRTLDQPKYQQTRKRLRQRRSNNPQREQVLTTGEDTSAITCSIAQQVQHTDRAKQDACKRKQRESESIHDNPRKRKK